MIEVCREYVSEICRRSVRWGMIKAWRMGGQVRYGMNRGGREG